MKEFFLTCLTWAYGGVIIATFVMALACTIDTTRKVDVRELKLNFRRSFYLMIVTWFIAVIVEAIYPLDSIKLILFKFPFNFLGLLLLPIFALILGILVGIICMGFYYFMLGFLIIFKKEP